MSIQWTCGKQIRHKAIARNVIDVPEVDAEFLEGFEVEIEQVVDPMETAKEIIAAMRFPNRKEN